MSTEMVKDRTKVEQGQPVLPFYLVCDVIRFRAWATPLIVVGMNSIAIYLLSNTMKPWFREQLQRHVGPDVFKNGGWLLGGGGYATEFAPMFQAALFLLALWLIAWWMFRRRDVLA